MKQSSILLPILIPLFSLQTQAQIIFNHTFDEGTGSLNSTAVDTGTGSWVAGDVVTANGGFSTGSGSATLGFTPSQGTQYQLDATIMNVNGITGDWVGVGFANGQSTGTGSGDRFTSQAGVNVEGRAWMMMRGTNSGTSHRVFTEGSSDATDWAGPSSLTQSDGGDFDVRILLDTTGGAGTWTATWFAKFSTDGSFTEVRSTFNLPNESINSVGFAFADGDVNGTLSSFTLTQVPEPSVFALIAGCFGLGWVMIRRRQS